MNWLLSASFLLKFRFPWTVSMCRICECFETCNSLHSRHSHRRPKWFLLKCVVKFDFFADLFTFFCCFAGFFTFLFCFDWSSNRALLRNDRTIVFDSQEQTESTEAIGRMLNRFLLNILWAAFWFIYFKQTEIMRQNDIIPRHNKISWFMPNLWNLRLVRQSSQSALETRIINTKWPQPLVYTKPLIQISALSLF